ncbi:hypothetical protein K438DRAFT_300447 [Mycena galopus ATCC 62051]|nr:hypothetical protein K438DRAFT_300447 [Mycena galopus ATCC 62051]
MYRQSLLFPSHNHLNRPGMLDVGFESLASAHDMAGSYRATPLSSGRWNYENGSLTGAQPPTEIGTQSCDYRNDIDASHPQSPRIKFEILPYSPSFPPAESRSPWEFGVLAQNAQWSGGIRPLRRETQSLTTSPEWPPLSIGPFNSDSWNEMMTVSALDANSSSPACPQYTFPSSISLQHLLPCPSPPPSLSPSGSESSSCSPRSGPRCVATPSGGKICSHCNATSTPLWRRDPATRLPLCNACGLYLQQRNKMRPAALIAADHDDDEADVAPGAPECSHCHTHCTSVWRRSKSGAKLCNACGVYARLRGRDRPLSLRRNKIRPRCKHAKQT